MLASVGLYVGIAAGAVLVVIIVALAMRGKHQPAEPQKPQVPADPPPAVDAAVMTPAPTHMAEPEPQPAPEPAKPKPAPEPKPVEEAKPATLQVEALAPSMTDTMPALAEESLSPSMTDSVPMLGAEADDMKMGTDELPKFGTAEVPKLDDGSPKYRTPAAQELSDAIASGTCPKCKAPTFVGDATSDDNTMYTLEARCGACGHKAKLIDMRVG
ncbi:MAG: hypothetical protein H6840_11610 [Planctomycetes bacterium]|nr:hypothetical protein [Planctomycetota bacterium]